MAEDQAALTAKRTAAVARDVEVEMVTMKAVGIRPQDRAERPTGPAMQLAQDTPLAPGAPIAQHRQLGPIGQADACDVDGIAAPMLGNPRTGLVVAGPARIGGHNPQRPHTDPIAPDIGHKALAHPLL